jgi:hypothetical protein
VLRLCIALDAASVSGIHLIELAGRQHGLHYSLGFGGQAVCSLAGVGVTGGDCFAEYPEFWAYWHGDWHGGWSWASSGAGSARVRNGGVEGWVWGVGDSAATHDRPPPTRIDDVCSTREPSPSPSPEPSRSDEDSQGAGAAKHVRRDRKDSKDRATVTPTAPPADGELQAVGGTQGAGPGGTQGAGPAGPPLGLYLALGAAGVLVVGGRIRLRRGERVR